MAKLRQWGLLTGVAVVGILAVGWFLLVSPQRSHAAALRAQTAQTQQSNQTLATNVAMLRAQQRGLPMEQAWLNKFATEMPNNPALPSLIRNLSAAAADAGVQLQSLAPAQPAPLVSTGGTLTGTAPARVGVPTAAQAQYIQVTVIVFGGYFNIEQFLDDLEHLPRAMMVTQFTLAPGSAPTAGPSGGSSGSSGTSVPSGSTTPPGSMLSATINARVFVDPFPATAAPGATR